MAAPYVKTFWFMSGGALVAVVLASGLGFGMIRYIQSKEKTLRGLESELALLEEQRSGAHVAAKILGTIERERIVIEASVADPAQPLPFIESIEGLAKRSGVRLELGVAAGQGQARAAEYSLAVDGPFQSVVAFLRDLELSPFLSELRGAELNRMSASPAGPTGGEALVRLTTVIRIIEPLGT